MRVHRALGAGFLESVFHRALLHELRKAGLPVGSEKRLKVFYDGVVVGDFDAGLFVEETVLIELKAVRALNAATAAQLVNYLAATGVEPGLLLLNFGTNSLGI